jgi:hypothetical protein
VIPHGEKFINYLGTRSAILFGLFFLSAFYFALAKIIYVWILFIVFTLIVAPIYGLLYMTPFLVSWKYFPLYSSAVNAIL